MVDIQTKDRFIELRAQGISYEKIATTLSVTKQTLINWSKENRCELANMRKISREALLERLKLTELSRLEGLSLILKKLREEIEKRDFSNLSTDKLAELFLKYIDLNQKINSSMVFVSKEGHEISLLHEKEWKED